MGIGERLKQARLEKGLSQRALCGDVITRNMLSQIENGSANPSMDTLRYLAGRLEKPVGYFLDEPVASPDEAVMAAAREAFRQEEYARAVQLLGACQQADAERFLLEAMALLAMAQEAVETERLPYARDLLEKARLAGAQTMYYTDALERKRLLLCCQAYPDTAPFLDQLPDITGELIARAKAAQPERRLSLLAAARGEEAELLKGQTLLELGRFSEAAECLHKAEPVFPKQSAVGLEICYREQKDFEKAYFYACKCRQL